MKYPELKKITKLYFGYKEISKVLGISPESARVSANRYVKQGFLIRVKRNLYVLEERWRAMGKEDKFTLANLAQVPSYISLMTAMEYYEVTTQMQRDYIESVAMKRTREIEVEETVFSYTRIAKQLYFGFSRVEGFFIAMPEKAFLDALYLKSLKRYSFDETSIDFGKLDAARVRKLAKRFPKQTRRVIEENEYFKGS